MNPEYWRNGKRICLIPSDIHSNLKEKNKIEIQFQILCILFIYNVFLKEKIYNYERYTQIRKFQYIKEENQ